MRKEQLERERRVEAPRPADRKRPLVELRCFYCSRLLGRFVHRKQFAGSEIKCPRCGRICRPP